MNKIIDEVRKFNYFGATSEQIIGYFYSGLLATLIFTLLEPAKVKSIIDSLGSALSILMTLGIGIGLYTIYFQIIGEFFLFQIQRLFHRLIDLIIGNKGVEQTSTTGYLGYLGVPFFSRRRAYETIKNEFEENPSKSTIHLSHGEIHVLYITSSFLIFAAIYSYWLGYENANTWLNFGIASLIGALVSDTKQHIKETYLFKAFGEINLKRFLEDRKLIKREISKQENELLPLKKIPITTELKNQ